METGDGTAWAGVDSSTRFYILRRYTYHSAELDAGKSIVFANGTHDGLDGLSGLSSDTKPLVLKKKGKYLLLDYSQRGDDVSLGKRHWPMDSQRQWLTRSMVYSGYWKGIDLSLSRSIVEAHQGRLWATTKNFALRSFSPFLAEPSSKLLQTNDLMDRRVIATQYQSAIDGFH